MNPTRRTTNPPLRRTAVAISIGLAALVAACTSDDATGTTDPPLFTTTVAPTTTFAVSPPTSSTTTVPAIDYLASCVEHAKFQAFTGNEFWAEIWDGAGRDDDVMRGACEFLATDQPGWLEEIHGQWVALQAVADPGPDPESEPVASDPAPPGPTTTASP